MRDFTCKNFLAESKQSRQKDMVRMHERVHTRVSEMKQRRWHQSPNQGKNKRDSMPDGAHWGHCRGGNTNREPKRRSTR